MENEKKVQRTKVEVQKENVIESGYPGITIKEDLNFKSRKELSDDEIRMFTLVLCQTQTKFTNKADFQKDAIELKVYPCIDEMETELKKYDDGKKGRYYSDFVVLNLDKKVRLDRMEYLNTLLVIGQQPVLDDKIFRFRRYARFITGVNMKTKERYYRAQIFFTENCVKSFFFSKIALSTMSMLIKSGYIAPVTFIEPSQDDDDVIFEKEEKKEE